VLGGCLDSTRVSLLTVGPSQENSRLTSYYCCYFSIQLAWPKIVVLMGVALVTGVLIWQFAPIDKALDSILPNFNNTEDGTDPTVPVAPGSPTASPTPKPPEFVFMQCEDETQNCCNGLDTICDLRVNEIFYASVHNAMASLEDGNIIGPNHRFKLEGALEAGYRGINMDVCNCNGEYQLCHGICDLGARNPAETFGSISAWLDQNPTEFLMIVLEINSGVQQAVDLDVLYSKLSAVEGLVEKIYVHGSVTDPLPTLREMVDANKVRNMGLEIQDVLLTQKIASFSHFLSPLNIQSKRLMIFHYNGPTTCAANDCPLGFHYWFEYAGETEYSFRSVSDVLSTIDSCEVTRGSAQFPFFAINSFVTPPSRTDAIALNSLSFAKTRLETCSSLNDSADVNLIFADFWSEGDLAKLAQERNAALVSRRERRHLLRTN
jgi:hypothetical protein